jgi:capsular polysaccharide biosynthesis protein
MEFSEYLRIFRKRGWLILLLMALLAGAAWGFSRMQEPVYKSTVRLLITSRPDFGQTQATKSLLRDFAAWMYSSFRAERVIEELSLDAHPLELLGNLKVVASNDSNIIMIEVLNRNGDVANDIARVWGDQLIRYRIEQNTRLRQEDRIYADFLDNPVYGLESPKTRINTLAGAVFGALVGVMLIFLLEWLDSGRLRRAEDITRLLDLPVIGKIPGE